MFESCKIGFLSFGKAQDRYESQSQHQEFICVLWGKEVLKGLNLTVPSPGITCLVGANGSGKTTLIRAILNHIRFKGEINFGDDTIASAIGSIGVVLDEPPFYGHISAIENLQLLMAVQNPGIRKPYRYTIPSIWTLSF